MTVDTPLPVAVDPPPQIVVPIAVLIDEVAVESENNNLHLRQPAPTICTVVAPATLEAGFLFLATVDGIEFSVVVPEGGVTEGHAFQVPYPVSALASMERPVSVTPLEISAPSSNILTGRWRNDLWSCFQVSHTGMFWQGWCCTMLLLGQVLTRNKLNVFGLPSVAYKDTFRRIVAIWVGCVLVFVSITTVLNLLAPARQAVPIMFGCFILIPVITANARYEMRRRYQLPVKCCQKFNGRCDDLCCGIWCSCCVIIQMARHTHPLVDYRYVCCSATGLTPEDAAATIV
jgi:Cys-rich protein (TIGR01571 family)